MHIDYGGTHDRGTVVDSYGTAQVVLQHDERTRDGARSAASR